MIAALVACSAAVGGAATAPLSDAAIRRSVARRAGGDGDGVRGVDGRRVLRCAGIGLVTAAFEIVAALRLGISGDFAVLAVFLPGLVALAWSDAECYLLPTDIVRAASGAVAVCLVASAVVDGDWRRVAVALCCGAGAFAAFLLMNLVNPRAMAFGDVRLAGAIGLAAGAFGARATVRAFVLAVVVAGVVAVVLLAARRITLRSRLPFGVFLAVGTLISLLA